jgi:hypothetical protein
MDSKFSEKGAQWSGLATEEIQQSNEQDHLSELIFSLKFIIFPMQDIIQIVE